MFFLRFVFRTGEKLNAFIEDEQTQEMRQALEKRKALEDNPMVNTNLS